MKLYRPATVIIGVLFVLLGGVARLADPDQVFEDQARVVARGTIGQDMTYGESTLTITRMKFVKSFLASESADETVQTKGIFVAVEYDAVRGPGKPEGNSVAIRADGGSVYKPVAEVISSGITFPEPGFAQTGAFVFEVNPADAVGLTFQVKTTRLFNSLAEDLAIDLGVPDDAVLRQSIETAGTEYVLPKPSLRVAE